MPRQICHCASGEVGTQARVPSPASAPPPPGTRSGEYTQASREGLPLAVHACGINGWWRIEAGGLDPGSICWGRGPRRGDSARGAASVWRPGEPVSLQGREAAIWTRGPHCPHLGHPHLGIPVKTPPGRGPGSWEGRFLVFLGLLSPGLLPPAVSVPPGRRFPCQRGLRPPSTSSAPAPPGLPLPALQAALQKEWGPPRAGS